MFKFNEKFDVDRRNLKCDYIRYTPSESETINTVNTQIYISIYLEKILLLAC